MSMQDKFDQHVWLVLQKIEDRIKHSVDGKPAHYLIRGGLFTDSDQPVEDEKAVFEMISTMGVTEVKDMSVSGTPIHAYSFRLIQPQFTDLYRKYRSKFEWSYQIGSRIAKEIVPALFGKDGEFEMPKLRKQKIANGIEVIKTITVVEQEMGNIFLVVVNDKYENPIEGDKAKPSWSMLYDVATGKKVSAEGKRKRNSLTFFNGDRRCSLYTRTGLKPTKILRSKNGFIEPVVDIQLISQLAFKKRRV